MDCSLPLGGFCSQPREQPPTRLRLYCFPHAGGSASVFRGWQSALGAGIEVRAMQLPGREWRSGEAPFVRMGALVDALLHFLKHEVEETPYALFGHSLGAKVAFEFANALTDAGARAPELLIVAGCPALQLRDSRPRLHTLPDDALLTRLWDLNGTPREVLSNRELMACMLPRLRADYTLSETHVVREEARTSAPILALGGSRDPEATPDELLAWRALTTGGFELKVLPGHHFFVHSAREELTALIRERLVPDANGQPRRAAPVSSPAIAMTQAERDMEAGAPPSPGLAGESAPDTLVALLDARVRERLPHPAYVYLKDGELPIASLSYPGLRRRALQLAAFLSRRYARGERALLFCQPGLGFLEAFWACLYAGIVAVPLPMPRLSRGEDKLRALVADARPVCVLTTAPDLVARDKSGILPFPVHCIGSLTDADSELAVEPARPDSVAYLQYTSGSTSTPKGVMISHANVIHNCSVIRAALGGSAEDVVVSWLPHFHDLGLVFGLLFPIYLGATVRVLPPVSFMQEPLRWLRAISRHRGTLSAAPNFAFDFCVEHATDEALAQLDLSSWRAVINGAEPVRERTVKAFCARFAGAGFAASAMRPSYGLAEATLVVSSSTSSAAANFHSLHLEALKRGEIADAAQSEKTTRVADCGGLFGGTDVAIANPESLLRLPDRAIGEIWVRNASVALGYFGRKDESESVFAARLAETDEGPYLRTGDLGYLDAGALFVTGRLKDLLIVRGRNYYPQDIEALVSASHDGFELNGAAAFAVTSEHDASLESEQLVVFQEVARRERGADFEALARVVERAVSEQFGVPVHAVVFLSPRRLPRTSSGKVQRSACRAAFLAGAANSLAVVRLQQLAAQSTPETAERSPEVRVAEALRATLGIELDAGMWRRPLIDLGLESIHAIAILARMADLALSTAMDVEHLLSGATAWDLCEAIGRAGAAGGRQGAAEAPTLERRSDDAHLPFPLTDVQQAYWLGRGRGLELGGVGCHAYFEFDAESLDVERFFEAFRRVVARHPMLSAVVTEDGEQRVLAQPEPFEPQLVDLTKADAEARQRALLELRGRLAQRVFSAAQPPLLGATLVRVSETTTRVLLDFDLLFLDYFSLGILSRELRALYSDPQVTLPELTVSFRDYALWERERRSSAEYRAALEYWKALAPKLAPGPIMPLAKRPAEVVVSHFTRRSFRLPASAWQRLRSAARERGSTPSGVVLAAFCEVLRRWAEKPSFSLMLTLFDRPASAGDFAHVVGDFTSVVPLDVPAVSEATFAERAGVVQRRLWQNLKHRAVSGVRVTREAFHGARVGSLPVVFTSALGLTDAGERAPFSWVGTEVFAVSQTPQVWLDHQVFEDAGDLVLVWDAVEELFPSGCLDACFESYTQCVARLAQEPSSFEARSVVELPMRQLAVRANANALTAPMPEGLLHDGFSLQARLRPDAPAVICGGQSFTYGALERASNALAKQLRSVGAGPNQLVAVAMEKCADQVLAVLGILKSGAAYLPVDPELPTARFNAILAQGGVRFVVTRHALLDSVDWPQSVATIAVEPFHDAAPADCGPLEPVQTSTDLAYVIFTSGSTGQPKGVMIDHRGALNTIAAVNRLLRVRQTDRVFGISALSFDLSVYDVFGLLAAGGAVVIPDHDKLRDPAHWLALLREHDISVWNSVPALFEMFTEYVSGRAHEWPVRLRACLLSGDWIPVSLPDRARSLSPDLELWSLGGATEASIWSIAFPIGAVEPSWRSIPYGKPLDNQRFHVLGPAFEDCPEWVPGRLYIGGVGLALGYFGDEERTRERFVSHPGTGERLYWTGDLGRYLPDGNIEFLGREDLQVKIQGYRVELEEIEAVLSKVRGVRASAVLARAAVSGGKRLVGYVVPEPKLPLSAAALSAALARQLPSYMVPPQWVVLERLPLTANGKVDRQALAGMEEPVVLPPAAAIADELDARFREVCAALLRTQTVGLTDNFFAVGGDSLLATRLATKVRELWGVELTLQTIFERPALGDLLEEIQRRRSQAQGHEEPSLILGGANYEPFPLTDVQSAYWLGRSPVFALGGVACQGYLEFESEHLDAARLRQALESLVERHDMLRAVVRPDGRQRILPVGVAIELPILDLRSEPAAVQHELLETERQHWSHAQLSVEHAPLFRVALTRLSEALTRVHLNVDLLIMDYWSFRIFSRELQLLYECPERELPPLALSFRDYVLHQKALERAPEYAASLEYWRQRVKDLPGAPSLPLVKDPVSVVRPHFFRRTFRLDSARWSALKARAQAAGVSASATLLAAFATTLFERTRQSRFTLNVTLFNRGPIHPDVDRVIGDFTTVTLLACDSAAASFVDRARSLQGRLWQDLDHRRVSGVRVLGELAKHLGQRQPVNLPVVFTSTLGTQGEPGDAPLAWLGREVYGISQTPQVYLDHQLGEDRDGLWLLWDTVDELFEEGFLDALFRDYTARVERLAVSPASFAEQLGEPARPYLTDAAIPGELERLRVENALLRHPAVRDARVRWDGQRRLRAEAVPDELATHDRAVVVDDPLTRLGFKLQKRSVRRDLRGVPYVLERPVLDSERVEAMVARRSYRNFDREPILLPKLSALLGALLQEKLPGIPLPKALYASAGGLYPVQTYLYVKPGRVEGLSAGTYYYDPERHVLLPTGAGFESRMPREAYPGVNAPVFDEAAFCVFLVADAQAIEPIYGRQHRHFAALEAGIISHLLESNAPRHGLGLCQVGALEFELIRRELGLGASDYFYLHGLLGGAVRAESRTLDALVQESAPIAAWVAEATRRGFDELLPQPRSRAERDSALLRELDAVTRTALGDSDVHVAISLESAASEPGHHAAPADDQRASLDELEVELLRLWEQLLQSSGLSVERHFFEAGGTSLLLVQLANRIRERFGTEISVIALFENPTVRKQARYLRALAEPQASSLIAAEEGVPPIPRAVRADENQSRRDRQRRARLEIE